MWVIAVAVLALVGCYKCVDAQCSNLPPVEPDYPGSDGHIDLETDDGTVDGISSLPGRACERLRAVGCPEGMPNARGTSCYRVIVRAARLQRLPLSCIASAGSQDAVRACGFVRCKP